MSKTYRIKMIVPRAENLEFLSALVSDLIGPTRAAFGTAMEESDIETHIVGGDFVYVIRLGEAPVGFCSFNEIQLGNINPISVLYLNGIAIAEGHQKHGLMKRRIPQKEMKIPLRESYSISGG